MANLKKTKKIAPDIVFENLTFSKRNLQERKTILKEINGTFPSGKLIGIMGPSGAGKTTLLNVLSGWDHDNEMSGGILVNNEKRNIKDFKSISCYITQDSYLLDVLTVEENLRFAADFKLRQTVSQSTKQHIINEIVTNFGLYEHLQTPTSKLSGGQRKRLAICMGLLNDPDVIFLDEPTTGLDTVSMFQCMRHLKQLTEHGNTVICTLHQPPGNVVEMFDVVYIVAQGQCVYQGRPQGLVTFLGDNGIRCELFHSPIDYLIEIANNDYGPKLLDTLLESSENGRNHEYMPPFKFNEITNNGKSEKSNKMVDNWGDYSFKGDMYEFRTMLKREVMKLERDWYLTYLRIVGILSYSLLIGITCRNIGKNVVMLYFNYNMILLHIAIEGIFFSLWTSVVFTLNQKVLRNEYENSYYSIRNYFLSSIIMDLPVTVIGVGLGANIVYYLTGQLMTVDRIIMFTVLSVEMAMIASSIGFLVGTIFNLSASAVFVTFIHIPIFVVSGFGLSIHDMPRHFYYLSHLAYARFMTRSSMGVVFGYNRPDYECPEEAEYCSYRNSSKFLIEMGLEDYSFVLDALILFGFYVFIRALTYIAIRYRLKRGIYIE